MAHTDPVEPEPPSTGVPPPPIPEDPFWERDAARRQNRRALLWVLIGLLFALFAGVAGFPRLGPPQ